MTVVMLLVVSIYALVACALGWYLETFHGAELDKAAHLLGME